jgi:hypothetical protein
MIGRDRFNPKRRLQPIAGTTAERRSLDALARRVRYGGNPEHKRNPGDFGLTPPSSPRPGKTLCDDANVHSRSEAVALLQAGLRRGLVSAQTRNDWPQNVWAVTAAGIPLEAELENQATGSYHGYPMPHNDPLLEDVLKRWGSQ